MSTKPNFNKLAEEFAASEYRRGWNDALSAINTSVRNIGKKNNADDPGTIAPAMRRPRRGSDADKVLIQITEKPGLTGVEIVSALEAAKNPVHERTVRTNLHRLRDRFIMQKDERWYPMT